MSLKPEATVPEMVEHLREIDFMHRMIVPVLNAIPESARVHLAPCLWNIAAAGFMQGRIYGTDEALRIIRERK